MKMWHGILSDELAHLDSYDWIVWSLAEGKPQEYYWIDYNVEHNEVVTMYAMRMLQNAEDNG